jgi:phosphinothricin acetyltransferase
MIQIREAGNQDLPQLLEIFNDVIRHTTAIYYYEPHTLEMRKAWFEEKKQHGIPVFVADEDGKILGFSTLGPFRAPTAYKYSVENTVHVAREARGRGIGKMLMKPLIDTAVKLQMHTIIAGIDATNEVSLKLHRQFGFVEVAHFKQVGFKFGKWLDLKFLQLMLPTPDQPVDG